MVTTRFLSLALLATLAVACGRGAPAVEGPAANPYDGEWQLLSGSAENGPLPRPKIAALVIAGAKLSGSTGCNSYDATAKINGSAISVDSIRQTEIGCPEEIATNEVRYLEALQAATRISRQGNRLEITGPGSQLRYRFVPPTPPASFEGTAWHLDSLVFGSGDAGAVSTTATWSRSRTFLPRTSTVHAPQAIRTTT